MEKKYVYSIVKIPMEIKPNGEYVPLKDLIQIDFSECTKLPEKQFDNNNVMLELQAFLNKNTENSLDVPVDTEIKIKQPIVYDITEETESVNENEDESENKTESSSEKMEPQIYDHQLKKAKKKKNTSFKVYRGNCIPLDTIQQETHTFSADKSKHRYTCKLRV